MIIADEWLLGASVTVAGYIGYMTKYLMFEMKKAVESNTIAINALVTIVQRCDRK
jgi:hypothetical protein